MAGEIVVLAEQLPEMVGKNQIWGKKLAQSGDVRAKHRGTKPVFDLSNLRRQQYS